MTISFLYPGALWLLLLAPLMAWLALSGPRRPTLRRFWAGLALRLALLLFVVLALAGLRIHQANKELNVVFLLDVSDSVSPELQELGQEYIRSAISQINTQENPGILDNSTANAAVIMFGEEALVERLISESQTLPGFDSIPMSGRTDIASALQLALALFPGEGGKRIVLLSDGQENLGRAMDQTELLTSYNIQLVYYPLSGEAGSAEVRVDAITAPARLRQGETGDVSVTIHSSTAMPATLRIFDGDTLVYNQAVNLQQGSDNQFNVQITAGEPGFRRFRAQVLPVQDTWLQNNEASAFSVVYGPPQVLIVEGQPGEANLLAQALTAASMQVTVIPPGSLPATLPALAEYDSIILANVSSLFLPASAMETLPAYVRDLGRGLLMIGGGTSFGAGGYLRTPIEEAMPVYMDVRAKEQSEKLALVLAIDKSGSMGRCHCDDPDLAQAYNRVEVGQPKVDIAKAAVMSAAEALSQQDELGVVAFDDAASWAFNLSTLNNLTALDQAIGGIQAFGQTNVRSGVEAAYQALLEIEARKKHVIMLTDGWTYSGDITALVQEMNENGITFSIVAAGSGSAEYLEALAETGGGRYYPAQDILSVPDIFLKETVKAVGEYIIEEPFFPIPGNSGPALRGLDPTRLPALLGYNGTTPKNTARVELYTQRGDPLLATWQYGLGRSAAWTSDLKAQWGAAFVSWDHFAQFAAQLVSWTLPAPQMEGVSAQAFLDGSEVVIRAEALDPAGQPLNFLQVSAMLIGPELAADEIRLPQVGAGQYETRLNISQAGAYLVRLGITNRDGQPLGQETLGLAVPYSPEYKEVGLRLPLLDELARRTQGYAIDPAFDPFSRTEEIIFTASVDEIWRWLLLVVALLFPLDVAIRRVRLDRRDFEPAIAWVRERLPVGRKIAAPRTEEMGQLFNARERVRQRETVRRLQAPPRTPPPTSDTPAATPPSSTPPPAAPGDAASPPTDATTLDRLREAKKRAGRK